MLTEGAGELDASAYQERLSALGASLTFSADRDILVGRLEAVRDSHDQVFELLRLALIASGDVAETDVDAAKSFLKGALPLSLDGTSAMAGRLLAVQRLGLDIDHLTAWNARVDAVTTDMVRALARRLMRPDDLTFAIAGDPSGM